MLGRFIILAVFYRFTTTNPHCKSSNINSEKLSLISTYKLAEHKGEILKRRRLCAMITHRKVDVF